MIDYKLHVPSRTYRKKTVRARVRNFLVSIVIYLSTPWVYLYLIVSYSSIANSPSATSSCLNDIFMHQFTITLLQLQQLILLHALNSATYMCLIHGKATKVQIDQ